MGNPFLQYELLVGLVANDARLVLRLLRCGAVLGVVLQAKPATLGNQPARGGKVPLLRFVLPADSTMVRGTFAGGKLAGSRPFSSGGLRWVTRCKFLQSCGGEERGRACA